MSKSWAGDEAKQAMVSEHIFSYPVLTHPTLSCVSSTSSTIFYPLTHTGGTCSHLDAAQSRSERRLTGRRRWWWIVLTTTGPYWSTCLTPQANASRILALALGLAPTLPKQTADQVPFCGQQTAFGLLPAAASASAKLSLHAGSCTCLERDQACILAAPVGHD